ncbi:hypothetical protein NKI19_29680 [Mesorhizobium sp. M0751]|uniref:hypothetical protein n=1 Tax=unclassified Mesorhizobium TaxID=325217 RepID=UPI00333A4431
MESFLPIKKIAILALLVAVFATAFLVITVTTKRGPTATSVRASAALKPLDGKLAIQSIDDFRVGSRKILLCGVAFRKPWSMRALMTEALRRDYNGLVVTCRPVGTGTPCDGNMASKLGDAVVVQCFMADGTDLAERLIESGLLCGQPAQAGSTYRTC